MIEVNTPVTQPMNVIKFEISISSTVLMSKINKNDRRSQHDINYG